MALAQIKAVFCKCFRAAETLSPEQIELFSSAISEQRWVQVAEMMADFWVKYDSLDEKSKQVLDDMVGLTKA